ncbi:NADPH-dependent ferric siderophore reductase [Kribbella amoyensis]|uniref:NADPH-dependent ferric siderophore reductase n=1 Tax=Kribbella amoyensis TaxID=996641 RepID=A0A561BVD4_9ACTN|nr:siderophore-interacting protein [Kribbella amoyensis]TWD82840.1 NADPH-dependent ferric siderophore reductase [Kribbella amoyensis]
MNRDHAKERVAALHTDGTVIERIPYPIGIRTPKVAAKRYVTPHLLRVTLEGPGLDGFHSYQCDDHVKIVFPDPDGTHRVPVPNDRQMLDWPRPIPTTRRYTVRRYAGRELELEFVVHPGGLAATWAEALAIGDEVAIAGPPGAKAFPHNYDHYVFAVDPTGLPAAARWLEESPEDVSADLVVEFDHDDETAYPLAERPGVRVRWVPRSLLAATVMELPPAAGRAFLFAAGEADGIRPLRAWSKNRLDHLVTGYWKRGAADHADD